jgi:hypothetical protein
MHLKSGYSSNDSFFGETQSCKWKTFAKRSAKCAYFIILSKTQHPISIRSEEWKMTKKNFFKCMEKKKKKPIDNPT